jgi:pyruvate/2-oxoglutarate dehydrogenase complex dihydrolipoamide acyltransferase (E2) component
MASATVHPVLAATLSADHRTSDGNQGVAFIERIARLVQDPEALGLTPQMRVLRFGSVLYL